MPHLTIEYSKNLEKELDTKLLLHTAHMATKDLEGIDINRVKSRLVSHESVLNGIEGEEISMIHLTFAILEGRTIELRASYCKTFKELLEKHGEKIKNKKIYLSVEIREMDKPSYFTS
ncbi:MAG: hypothetical protein QE271_10830 [Bacteriovoracaceae bacterium]|nr:hypothetical protein [Bacteriovoracaceae bacterium]